MPLPSRKLGESRDEFISRCVRDVKIQSEFPNLKQRVAVCSTQANTIIK
jgi:hypothetical protein